MGILVFVPIKNIFQRRKIWKSHEIKLDLRKILLHIFLI